MSARPHKPLSIVVAIALAGFAAPAFAYLDPSTGSMILSAIVGIFATVGLALKTYWYKLKSFFRSKSLPPARQPEPAQDSESSAG